MATIITRFYLDSDFIPKELLLQDKPLHEKELFCGCEVNQATMI